MPFDPKDLSPEALAEAKEASFRFQHAQPSAQAGMRTAVNPVTGEFKDLPASTQDPRGNPESKVRWATPDEIRNMGSKIAENQLAESPAGMAAAMAGKIAKSTGVGTLVMKAAESSGLRPGLGEDLRKVEAANPKATFGAGVVGDTAMLVLGGGALKAGSALGRVGVNSLLMGGQEAQKEIGEGILGDTKVTASTVGSKFLTGAVIGAGTSIAGELAGAAVKAAKNYVASQVPTLAKLAASGEAASTALKDTLTGTVPKAGTGEIAEAVAKAAANPASAGSYVKAVEEMAANATKATGEATGIVTKELEALAAVPKDAVVKSAEYQGLAQTIKDLIPKSPGQVAALPEGTATTLLKVNKSLADNAASQGTAADLRAALSGLKSEVALMPESSIKAPVVEAIDKAIASKSFGKSGEKLVSIEKAVSRFENAKTAAQGLDANTLVTRAPQAAELHESSIALHNVIESVGKAHAPTKSLGEMAIEKLVDKGKDVLSGVAIGASYHLLGPLAPLASGVVRKTVEGGVDLVTAMLKKSGAAMGTISATANALATGAEATGKATQAALMAGGSNAASWYSKSKEERKADYEKKVKTIQELAANPDKLQASLTAHIGDVANHAPQTAIAIAANQSRVVQYLNSMIPMKPNSFLGGVFEPSNAEMYAFNNIYNAATDPMSLMPMLLSSTLTPEAVSAVSTCHPELYSVMKQNVMAAAHKNQDKMPYQNRVMAAMLVGQDLDGTMTPFNSQMSQALHAPKQPEQPQGGAVGPSQTGLGKISIAERTSTDSSAMASRQRKV